WFNEFAQQSDLPPKSSLTIFDKKGVILAHFPNPEFWVGNTIQEGAVEHQILAEKKGTIRGFGADGLERLYAFMPLAGSEESVFVSLGIPVNYAFAEVNHTMIRNLLLISLVTLLLLVGAWLLGEWVVMRPIRDLVHTTQQLAKGNLNVRVDTDYNRGEFAVLVQSIDEMAEALSNREAERLAAEKANREYAADLERSNRDLLDFANIASHDLQEPLRKIANFSDILLLRYSPDLDKRAQEYLNRIQASAKRMQSFIIALLSYSRLSTKAQPAEIVDLNEVITNVLSDLDLQIVQADAKISIEDLPLVKADPVQMHQLFLNLTTNSLKFRSPDSRAVIHIQGKVVVDPFTGEAGAKFDSGYFEISVKDNGIGFDEKYLDRIYQPFQRLHGYEDYEGTGMGLAICRKIIERHNGEIEAHSSPGEGATFVIRLPVIDPYGGKL
ncbi:MAG: ATP-binding protein, partial [Anaerolineales bacterium]|nr:ATP-binding protein [Anaerolineales bacterium]